MPFIINFFIIVIAILLYLAVYKLICWMCDNSKKSDMKWLGTQLENYEHDKKVVIAEVTVAFVILTIWAIFEVFTHFKKIYYAYENGKTGG